MKEDKKKPSLKSTHKTEITDLWATILERKKLTQSNVIVNKIKQTVS